jgi:ATP-dependent Zn protease
MRTELAVPYLAREYARFRSLLESVSGRTVDDATLQRSIALYNEARRLVREHRDALQVAAQELLKEEILDGQRFRALIEAKPAAAPPTTPPPPAA